MPIDSERTELLFQRVQRLLKRLPGHSARPEDIHALRTTIRRLETALDVLLPEPDRDARKLVKQMAKLRRRAGGVRDLDVQMFALRSLRHAPVAQADAHPPPAALRTSRRTPATGPDGRRPDNGD